MLCQGLCLSLDPDTHAIGSVLVLLLCTQVKASALKQAKCIKALLSSSFVELSAIEGAMEEKRNASVCYKKCVKLIAEKERGMVDGVRRCGGGPHPLSQIQIARIYAHSGPTGIYLTLLFTYPFICFAPISPRQRIFMFACSRRLPS